jgi:hypothetical protein
MGEVLSKIWLVFSAFMAVFLPSSSCFGQNQPEYRITWDLPTSVPDQEGDMVKALHFKEAVHYLEFDYVPVYPIEFSDQILESVKIEFDAPVKLSDEEKALLNHHPIKESPEIYLKKIKEGNSYTTRVWVLPFFSDPETGDLYKLNEFKLHYQAGKSPDIISQNLRIGAVNSSVLSDGNWYKLAVTEDGIYKVDYNYLRSLGIPVEDIDPRNIKIFGNGGEMLPQPNDAPRPEDLLENSIMVVGENDGKFNSGDYVLFYGQSPHKLGLKEEGGAVEVEYSHHDYADTSYYFITIADESGLRLSSAMNLGASFPRIRTFDYLTFHEFDQYNILMYWGSGSGREWYGEIFRIKTTYDFEIDVPGLTPNSPIKVISAVMAQSYSPTYFTLRLNSMELGLQEMDVIPNSTYAIKGRDRIDDFSMNTGSLPENTEKLVLRYIFTRGSSSLSDGYLDYFNIWCKRDLETFTDQVRFRSVESLSNPLSTFEIRDSGNPINIWDITDPVHPAQQEFSKENQLYSFGKVTDRLKEFILFNERNTLIPVPCGQVKNQDLHAMNTPELLIVTHPDFMSAANRLAIHRQQQGMSTKVVNIFQIYNEFSSGTQDITAIRDFIKFLYDKNPRLKSLLLFGRGSFDYKDRIDFNTNFVPIYESRNSLHPIYSYSSDDYYGFLDQNEGEWDETFLGDHGMDIGIGRLPVKSLAEANVLVDKIILYETNDYCYGSWRNDIYFVADDGDGTDGIRHSKDADRLSVLVDTSYSNFNIRKIYVDAYEQIIQPNQQEAPGAKEAIRNAVKNGALLINYTGHGSENQWTRENILNISLINQWDNIFKLPLLVTATCEFGRHDDPMKISGAEYALINDRGGAIGLVTTARPVFASTNFILNQSFYGFVFEKIDGNYQTIGEIFRKTKNTSLNGSVNRNFSLLGDPSMILAYPNRNLIIDKINESLVEEKMDTLEALKKVRVSGKVFDSDYKIMSGYNGTLTAAVYDKSQLKQTLGTQDPVMVYDERNSLIFRGDASIINGKFSFEFIVSKNIDYQIGEGKISLYSVDDHLQIDASGSNQNLYVGGNLSNPPEDNTPPEVILYMEDSTFNFGDLTSDHPNLIADIFDENGINLLENEISKGLIVALDDEDPFTVNQFYKADRDDYQKGQLNYQLSELKEGRHTVLLKVWDTHNNLTEAYTEFIVGEDNKLIIQNVLNYPNPFRDETRFSFEHNRSGENLSVKIQIYTIKGQLVKTIEGVTSYSGFRINDITWDGRGESGKKLESGLYVYRVFVRSLLDGAKNTAYQKLVIIK